MKLLATFLVLLNCVFAFVIPESHQGVIKDVDLKLHDDLPLVFNRDLGREDLKNITIVDKSVKNLIAAGQRRDNNELPVPTSTNSPESDSPASQQKQSLDEVDEYNRRNPQNQIPDWVFLAHPHYAQYTGTYHERNHIWETLQYAHNLRRMTPYLDRPRWSGTHYPHGATFTDFLDQQTDTRLRRLNLGRHHGRIYVFPIMMDGNFFTGGYAPFMDRIIFDEEGVYVGMLTFRGGDWYWGYAVRHGRASNPEPIRGASGRGFPGVDELAMRQPFPGPLPWINSGNPWRQGGSGR